MQALGYTCYVVHSEEDSRLGGSKPHRRHQGTARGASSARRVGARQGASLRRVPPVIDDRGRGAQPPGLQLHPLPLHSPARAAELPAGGVCGPPQQAYCTAACPPLMRPAYGLHRERPWAGGDQAGRRNECIGKGKVTARCDTPQGLHSTHTRWQGMHTHTLPTLLFFFLVLMGAPPELGLLPAGCGTGGRQSGMRGAAGQ